MPPFLRSKYQQYKRDNLQLATWLCRTAVQYGFPISAFKRSEVPLVEEEERRTAQQVRNAKKKKKAKGKAGHPETNTGEENDSAGQEATQTSLVGDYTLSIPQYTEISRYLVNNNVTIPSELMKLIRRCITLREKCLKQFLICPDESTAKHQYFITVLREAETILDPRREQDQLEPIVSDVEALQGDMENMGLRAGSGANRYAALPDEGDDLEDLPDIDLPAPPRPARSAMSTDRMLFATEMSDVEAIEAILTFYGDIHAVRRYVINLWGDYKNGFVDLMTASVTTNTAIELLRIPHEDLVSNVVPRFGKDFESVVLYLVKLFLKIGGLADRGLPLFDHLDPDETYIFELYDYLLVPNCQILCFVRKQFGDDNIPLYERGRFGEFNPHLDFGKLSFAERWHQQEILLLESVTDYFLLIMFGDRSKTPSGHNLFSLDEMAYELDQFHKSRKCTLLLLVTSQIFLDIVLTVGPQAKQGLRTLQTVAGSIEQVLSERPIVEGHDRSGMVPARLEEWARKLQEEAGTFKKTDLMGYLRRIFISSESTVGPLTKNDSSLMARSPMLCGLLLFRFQLRFQKIGLAIANAWGTILYTAHLFVAGGKPSVLLGRLGMAPWEDMELVMDLHGREDIFGGRVPETIHESYLCCQYMMGASTEALDSARYAFTDAPIPEAFLNLPRPLKAQSEDGPKFLENRTRVLPIFARKYILTNRAETHVSLDLITKLLSELGSAKVRGTKPLRRQRRHRSPKFSIIQVLAVLEQGLAADSTSLRFDYLSMHLRCLQVLRAVKDACHDYLTRTIGPDYFHHESQLPYLVNYIFHWAVISGCKPDVVGMSRARLARQPNVVGGNVLIGAAHAMRDFLRDTGEGDAEVKKLQSIWSA